MNFLSYKYLHKLRRFGRLLKPMLAVMVITWVFTSCIDEQFDVDGSGKGEDIESVGDALTFYINAGQGFTTRYSTNSDAEANENTVSSVRTFFFDKDGNFIFEAPKPSKEQVTDNDGNDLYKITVSIGDIKDPEGRQLANEIRKLFIAEKFKVAMTVNWPNSTRPNWNYYHSILNPDNKNGGANSHLKTLNDLHHIQKKDDNYNNNFSFLVSNDSVSDHRNWVQQRKLEEEYNVNKVNHQKPTDDGFSLSRENSAEWLRTYWDPELDAKFQSGESQNAVYRTYAGLWKLWNFGGSFTNSVNSYEALSASTWTDEWKQRNGNEFAKVRDNGGDGKWLGQYGNTWIIEETTLDGLTVVPTSTTSGDENKDKIIRSYNRNNYHGIILPRVEELKQNASSSADYKYYVNEDTKGYLKFTQENSGHLNIYYSAYGGQEKDDGADNTNPGNAHLRIMRGMTSMGDYTTNKIPSSNGEISSIEVQNVEIKITGDPEPIYIYTDYDSENSVVIYAIEFVSDTYLYETNREGISTSQQNIAMFGVQEYEPLGTWNNGETIDLKDKTPISLIRSVAKVEVYLPKKATNIFMRCMNRKANVEVMDVNTSTSVSWGKEHNEALCEWFTIQKYTPWITNGSESQYQSWLKWYFGTWKDWKKWGDVATSDLDYPRIFNPHIERSDFAEFIYVGEVNGSYKYVMYVPDKAVADPNDHGTFNSSPKVIHIEYRYKDNVSTNNLDDNKCYRIYFTNYSDNTGKYGPVNSTIKSLGPTEYENYEANAENLQMHWPIMRNHIYRFNVKESDPNNLTAKIDVKIDSWGYEAQDDWEEIW